MNSQITNKTRLIIITFLITVATSIITPLSPIVLAANGPDPICDNGNISNDIKAANGCSGYTEADRFPGVVTGILNAVITISGLIAVIFIIVGGIQYMTSSGDANKTKKAKDTILYACIGLVVCVLAFAIVNWAIAALSSSI